MTAPRPRTLAVQIALALVCLIGFASPAATASGVASTTTPVTSGVPDAPLFLVLDVSGSMNDGQPVSKIVGAKNALLRLVQDLPDRQQVALLTYPGGSMAQGCSTGELRYGLKELDRASLAAKVKQVSADGNTPTGPALLHVAQTFKASGYTRGTVLLISDGESNCGSPPVCDVARQLRAGGLDLVVNTVAFDINSQGKQELACIAGTTGGKSFEVDRDGDLRGTIELAATAKLDLSVQAPSVFTAVTGTRSAPENTLSVRVTSVGAVPASNVRVIVSVDDATGKPGAAYIARPVRYLGNLNTVVPHQTVTFEVSPPVGVAGPLTWMVRAESDKGPPVSKSGTAPIAGSTSLATAGPILTAAKHVVVMGDSYSSGEGAGDYDDPAAAGVEPIKDKASGVNLLGLAACHRSKHASLRLLFSEDVLSFFPCSGALTADLRGYQYRFSTPPQLVSLRELVIADKAPDLVIMTLGGNDAGFGDFISGCVWGAEVYVTQRYVYENPNLCGTTSVGTDGIKPFFVRSALLEDLHRAYLDIDAILNSQEAVRQRAGRVGQIVVLPYADPLPPRSQLEKNCLWLMGAKEADLAKDYVDALNQTVLDATTLAIGDGVPIHLVTSVRTALQGGHTMCDKDQTGVVRDLVSRAITNKQELGHPNQLGQRLISQSLVEWSRGESVDWNTGYVAPARDIKVESQLVERIKAATNPLGGQLFEPRIPIGATCADLVPDQLQCKEYVISKAKIVSLHSDATIVPLPVVADGEDALPDAVIPAGLEPGVHELVFDYLREDGSRAQLRTTIRVWPEGTHDTMRLLWIGTGLILLGLVMAGARALTRLRS